MLSLWLWVGQSQARVYWGRPPKYPPNQQTNYSGSTHSTASTTTSTATPSEAIATATTETTTESEEKVRNC